MSRFSDAETFDFADFFNLRTRAFVDKEFALAADALSLPTSVHFMGQRLAIHTLRDAIDALSIYRSNLCSIDDYADTKTVVLNTRILPNDMVRVHIQCNHYSTQGKKFGSISGYYFMRKDSDGADGWRIELIEALGGQDKRMIQNLDFG